MSESLREGDDPNKGGVKKDEGKLRWSLLPWDALEAVVRVLMFGANKYTFKYENKWEALFRASNATKLVLTVKDCVVTATKDSFDYQIRPSPKDKETTNVSGQNLIQPELKSWKDFEELIRQKESEIKKQNGLISYDVSDLTLNQIGPKDAPSAEAKSTCTLTMIIPQEGSEASFVVNTTTASASWETMWRALKQHSIISKRADHRELSGNRNWEQGMDYSRLFDAGLRHQIEWWQKGEAEAEDSKLHHLSHAACDALFLLAYEIRKQGTDDRPQAS